MTGDEHDYSPEAEDRDPNGEAPHDEAAILKTEMAELKDRLLRALADAENTRRRGEREKADASQYAVTKFARDMLTVADNLKRALDAFPPDARAAASVKAVVDGIEATERNLNATLERHGIRMIDTTGARFDPNLHQAIAEVPGEGRPAGAIVNVVQTGYVIGDRLLRPAMVTIANAASGQGAAQDMTGSPGSTIDTKI
jgi:molecular chaperone GrpE